MIRTTPTRVARDDRIQELSWQKLQYWTIVIRTAQHMNMVHCNEQKEAAATRVCH